MCRQQRDVVFRVAARKSSLCKDKGLKDVAQIKQIKSLVFCKFYGIADKGGLRVREA